MKFIPYEFSDVGFLLCFYLFSEKLVNLFSQRLETAACIAAGNCFPDVRSVELGELIGRSGWVGGRGRPFSTFGAVTTKNNHSSGTIRGKNTITINGLSIYRTIAVPSGKHLNVLKQIASKSKLSLNLRSLQNLENYCHVFSDYRRGIGLTTIFIGSQ
jgi:hypothetical protein